MTDWRDDPEKVRESRAACLSNWPEAWAMGYDPRCCRFPKSCSIEDEPAETSSPAPAGAEAPLPVRGDGDAGEERRREVLAEWLGSQPEARNIFDHTDEATTVMTIAVEDLAALLDAAGCRIPVHYHVFATRDTTWCWKRDLTFVDGETGERVQQGYPSTENIAEVTCEDCKARYAEVTDGRDANRSAGAD